MRVKRERCRILKWDLLSRLVRIGLEWLANAASRGASCPRAAGQFVTHVGGLLVVHGQPS